MFLCLKFFCSIFNIFGVLCAFIKFITSLCSRCCMFMNNNISSNSLKMGWWGLLHCNHSAKSNLFRSFWFFLALIIFVWWFLVLIIFAVIIFIMIILIIIFVMIIFIIIFGCSTVCTSNNHHVLDCCHENAEILLWKCRNTFLKMQKYFLKIQKYLVARWSSSTFSGNNS